MFTIGKLASQAAVSVDAIRYYEKEGLLRPAHRTEAGYRLYDQDARRRIHFIKHAQECGFTLAEIRELLELESRTGACCNDVRGIAIMKKLQLEQKIKTMKMMSNALTELVRVCDDDTKPLKECPILISLETTTTARGARRRKVLGYPAQPRGSSGQ